MPQKKWYKPASSGDLKFELNDDADQLKIGDKDNFIVIPLTGEGVVTPQAIYNNTEDTESITRAINPTTNKLEFTANFPGEVTSLNGMTGAITLDSKPQFDVDNDNNPIGFDTDPADKKILAGFDANKMIDNQTLSVNNDTGKIQVNRAFTPMSMLWAGGGHVRKIGEIRGPVTLVEFQYAIVSGHNVQGNPHLYNLSALTDYYEDLTGKGTGDVLLGGMDKFYTYANPTTGNLEIWVAMGGGQTRIRYLSYRVISGNYYSEWTDGDLPDGAVEFETPDVGTMDYNDLTNKPILPATTPDTDDHLTGTLTGKKVAWEGDDKTVVNANGGLTMTGNTLSFETKFWNNFMQGMYESAQEPNQEYRPIMVWQNEGAPIYNNWTQWNFLSTQHDPDARNMLSLVTVGAMAYYIDLSSPQITTTTLTLDGSSRPNWTINLTDDTVSKLAKAALINTTGDGTQFLASDGTYKTVGSGASTSWGQIEGNITDQTDLVNTFTDTINGIEDFNKNKYLPRAAKGFSGSSMDQMLLKNPDSVTTWILEGYLDADGYMWKIQYMRITGNATANIYRMYQTSDTHKVYGTDWYFELSQDTKALCIHRSGTGVSVNSTWFPTSESGYRAYVDFQGQSTGTTFTQVTPKIVSSSKPTSTTDGINSQNINVACVVNSSPKGNITYNSNVTGVLTKTDANLWEIILHNQDFRDQPTLYLGNLYTGDELEITITGSLTTAFPNDFSAGNFTFMIVDSDGNDYAITSPIVSYNAIDKTFNLTFEYVYQGSDTTATLVPTGFIEGRANNISLANLASYLSKWN